MSIHSIEMPFESTPSFYLNLIEKLEYMKLIEDVIRVHEVCILNNYPQFLKKVIRDCLATRAHYVEQVESYFEVKEDDNDELLLQEKYDDEFLKFLEKSSIEEQKISSDQIEKMEHNCENTCMDDELLFLDESFKNDYHHSGERTYVEDL